LRYDHVVLTVDLNTLTAIRDALEVLSESDVRRELDFYDNLVTAINISLAGDAAALLLNEFEFKVVA
jgi:hypothetical protein